MHTYGWCGCVCTCCGTLVLQYKCIVLHWHTLWCVGVGVGVGVGVYVGVGVGVGVGWCGIMNSLFNNSCVVYHRYDQTFLINFHHELWRTK